MAYSQDLPAAARRHLMAAESLERPGGRRDVAGYLYGLAAECAIKALMVEAGMRPTAERQRDDPFYTHFPELRTILRDRLQGRKGTLLNFVNDDRFMNQWDVSMRYSSGREIKDAWIDSWRGQARQAIASIGT
jgi:hypothetical protein